jgi:hypothetical protein
MIVSPMTQPGARLSVSDCAAALPLAASGA